MTNKDLIASGDLELYVAGLLSEERMAEISSLVESHEEIRKEVEQIEAVVMRLAKESASTSTNDFTEVLKKVVTERVVDDTKVISLKETTKSSKKVHIKSFAGWAAAAVVLIFFGWQYQQNLRLESSLSNSVAEREALEYRMKSLNLSLVLKEEMIASITSENTRIIQLAGQQISPESNVKVFWDTNNERVVLDVKNLPKAPKGMVYQVWSLKLSPLTPTSLGLLEGAGAQQNLFVLKNTNISEGFGITLEPEGGSKMPTLEKLYVLGTVSS